MRAVLSSLLCLLPALASAVDVQGALPADTVWKKSLSPYVLTGDVTVPWGAKLTVEAGVQIIAVPEDALRSGVDPQRVELIVDGTLAVRGTPSQPVEFTSHGRPGSWYGVRVSGGRNTVIDGAILNQASQGIFLDMRAVVKNTSVSALAEDCIRVTWDTSSLQDNDVSACGGRERAAPVRPQDNRLPPAPNLRSMAEPPALPAPRERPPAPRPTDVPRATSKAAPAPSPPPRPLPSTVGVGDCAIEPQVREPPECPGIRRWRKNQERLGGDPRSNAPASSSRELRAPLVSGDSREHLRVAPDTRRQEQTSRAAAP